MHVPNSASVDALATRDPRATNKALRHRDRSVGTHASSVITAQRRKHYVVANRFRQGTSKSQAERWCPLGRERCVVIDPLVSFGAPSIFGKGIRTANVFDMFLAERRKPSMVADWLDLEPNEIEAAVEFETQLKAA